MRERYSTRGHTPALRPPSCTRFHLTFRAPQRREVWATHHCGISEVKSSMMVLTAAKSMRCDVGRLLEGNPLVLDVLQPGVAGRAIVKLMI